MQGLILAAGMGKRLKALTSQKTMLQKIYRCSLPFLWLRLDNIWDLNNWKFYPKKQVLTENKAPN